MTTWVLILSLYYDYRASPAPVAVAYSSREECLFAAGEFKAQAKADGWKPYAYCIPGASK